MTLADIWLSKHKVVKFDMIELQLNYKVHDIVIKHIYTPLAQNSQEAFVLARNLS